MMAFHAAQRQAEEQLQQLIPGYQALNHEELRVQLSRVLTTRAFIDVSEAATMNAMLGNARYFLMVGITGNQEVTKIAQEVYYSSNFFRFQGVDSFRAFLAETPGRDDGGIRVQDLVERVSFSLRRRDKREAIQTFLQGLDVPRARMIVIQLASVSDVMLEPLRDWISGPVMQPLIDQISQGLAEGVLVTESQAGMGGSWMCEYPGLSGQGLGWTRAQSTERVQQMKTIWEQYIWGLHQVMVGMGEEFFEGI